jgi:hypothetical protein
MYEEITSRKCRLSLSAESFVFQFAMQKYKDWDIQNNSFASCFVLASELVSNIEGIMLAEGVRE